VGGWGVGIEAGGGAEDGLRSKDGPLAFEGNAEGLWSSALSKYFTPWLSLLCLLVSSAWGDGSPLGLAGSCASAGSGAERIGGGAEGPEGGGGGLPPGAGGGKEAKELKLSDGGGGGGNPAEKDWKESKLSGSVGDELLAKLKVGEEDRLGFFFSSFLSFSFSFLLSRDTLPIRFASSTGELGSAMKLSSIPYTVNAST